MYLTERLIGVISYTIVLLAVCFFVKRCNINNLKRILFVYLIILVLMAFFFVPPLGADLTRINRILDSYHYYSFSDLISEAKITSTPMANLYYWCIAKINIKGLISACTTFIVFNNLFYIIIDYSKKNKVNPKSVALMIFVIMSSGFFMEVLSTIRDMLAYSIIARCFYNEFYNKKNMLKNIPYYIFAFLFHQSVIALIGIRLIYLTFFEKQMKNYLKFIVLIVILVLSMQLSKYMIMSVDKYNLYLNNKTYSLIWEYIKGGIESLIILITIFNYKKINKNNFYKYNLLIMLLSLLYLNQYSIFVRFTYFNMFMMMPIFIESFNYYINKKKILIIIMLSVIMLGLACTRCDLSSLKFFEIEVW